MCMCVCLYVNECVGECVGGEKSVCKVFGRMTL
jgi:hypothetical protein